MFVLWERGRGSTSADIIGRSAYIYSTIGYSKSKNLQGSSRGHKSIIHRREKRIMGLYESTAVAEVEVLGDLTGSYCTSAGTTVSPGGVHDVRRNSLLSVGISEENREPGFLFLRVQPA